MTVPTATVKRTATIINQKGLHARAAAKLAETAGAFEANVTVAKDGLSVAAKSIMGLMMLAAAKGSDIEIEATGPDAEQALNAILTLIENRFDEEA